MACAASGTWGSKRAFSIHDDLLAFPQFQVFFPGDYVLESYTKELLQTRNKSPAFSGDRQNGGRGNSQAYLDGDTKSSRSDSEDASDEQAVEFEEMILQGRRYLCRIPQVTIEDGNVTTQAQETNKTEEQKELARATSRGLELLREMEGDCMYYMSGWWSYSFCYKSQIKQFHALPSGNGVPAYPPMEDPATQSFILGKFPQIDNDDATEGDDSEHQKRATESAELQTKGGSRYLVQRLAGGSKCDLTGRDRKIEVQFHCHPQTTDRIGWIKELTTCSYLMVIYTPRLCNDVAFLPPQQDQVHPIECREIISSQEIPEWEAMQQYRQAQKLVESASPEFPIIGGTAVGAQKLVGKEGKQIEKGRVASVGDQTIQVVAKRENGKIVRLSAEELERFDLDPEKIEILKKKLESVANGKNWVLEVIESDGERGLRWIIDPDEDEEEGHDFEDTTAEEREKKEGSEQQEHTGVEQGHAQGEADEDSSSEEPETGSEEIFKDEL